ncbi:MAG: hypothetical protein OQK07_05795, partial [Rhodospirillales bacterium]|nr:hypothetical protein [Rhodospirillales bacterium]
MSMDKLQRLEFVERQCQHALALIRESERTYDRNWARRLTRMADDMIESIAVALKVDINHPELMSRIDAALHSP